MKAFSFKNYKIIPFTDVDELNASLEKIHVVDIPEDVFATSDKTDACYFVVADKDTLNFVFYASFVSEKDNKKLVQVRFTSVMDDQKMLEKIITKISDYVYNNVGGIYFQINAEDVEATILSAAKKAGYKDKDGTQTFYVLDKNVEIGIVSLIANI